MNSTGFRPGHAFLVALSSFAAAAVLLGAAVQPAIGDPGTYLLRGRFLAQNGDDWLGLESGEFSFGLTADTANLAGGVAVSDFVIHATSSWDGTYGVTCHLYQDRLTVSATINVDYGLGIEVPYLHCVLDPDGFGWSVVVRDPVTGEPMPPDPEEPRQLPFTWQTGAPETRDMDYTCGIWPRHAPEGSPPGWIYMPNPYAGYNAVVFEVTQVPEPSTLLALLGCLAPLSLLTRPRPRR